MGAGLPRQIHGNIRAGEAAPGYVELRYLAHQCALSRARGGVTYLVLPRLIA